MSTKKAELKLNMDAVERIAIALCMGSDKDIAALKKDLPPGKYEGRVAMQVDFAVEKGAPTETAPTCDLLTMAILCKAIRRLPAAKREEFYKSLEEAYWESWASKDGKTPDEILKAEDEKITLEIENLKTRITTRLPKKERAGATKVTAKVIRLKDVQKPKEFVPAPAVTEVAAAKS